MTIFGELRPDGRLANVREIDQDSIRACPAFIMVPEHYRANGTCRCDDPAHNEMRAWGYRWNGRRWT